MRGSHFFLAIGGDYWRLTTPGRFEVIVQADGYEPMSKTVNVTNPHQTEALRVDFALQPVAAQEQLANAADINDVTTVFSNNQIFTTFFAASV